MEENMLEISGLRVHFDTLDGPIEALHSVDLSVKKGEIMGLVGESGCGKSVTSLVTIGLATCKIDSGSIRYDGKELLHKIPDSKRRIISTSSKITSFGILSAVMLSILLLINPIYGAQLISMMVMISTISWLVGFIASKEIREHDKFMRWVRGNEISMIFQEPMTALNPLYTIEKQVSEVMKEHKRLVQPDIPKSKRIARSLISPMLLIYEAFKKKPFPTSVLVFTILIVFAIHLANLTEEIDKYVFLLILGGFYDRSISAFALSSVSSLVIFLMLWMPLSALAGMVVISSLLALPIILLSDYQKLDPAHRNQVVEILEDVQIPNPEAVVGMYPHELSGGMRQRVMIAMMMACEPKLLIADEPTTALDVTIQAQILKLMKKLRDEKGTAILLITHDLGVIAEMCDSVTVMYAGNVVESGSLEQVLGNPRMPYSIGLLYSTPRINYDDEIRSRLPIIPGQVPDPNLHFDGCRFHPRCPFADELCVSTPPEAVEIERGHFALCHHTEKTSEIDKVQSKYDEFSNAFHKSGGI